MAGSSFGNGGLSNGPGAGPAALAFLALAELQGKYQEILQAKADLSTAAAQASQALVTDQNNHYSNEVQDQANEQYTQAISAGLSAIATAAPLLAMGPSAYKAVGEAQTSLAGAEDELSGMSKLQEGITKPAPEPVRAVSAEAAPGEDPKVTDAIQKLKDSDYKSLNSTDYDSETMAKVGAKVRGDMNIAERESATLENEETYEGFKARKEQENIQTYGAKNFEEFTQQLDNKVNQKLMLVNGRASKLNSVMMKVNFATQFVTQAAQSLASVATGLIKTAPFAGAGGESESEAHNAQQIDMLYSNLASAVMNDQMSQVTKAWELQTSVMTNIWKAISDAQRV